MKGVVNSKMFSWDLTFSLLRVWNFMSSGQELNHCQRIGQCLQCQISKISILYCNKNRNYFIFKFHRLFNFFRHIKPFQRLKKQKYFGTPFSDE